MRSGYIDIGDGALWFAGFAGYAQSATTSYRRWDGLATPSVYDSAFNNVGVYSSNGPDNYTNELLGRPMNRRRNRK